MRLPVVAARHSASSEGEQTHQRHRGSGDHQDGHGDGGVLASDARNGGDGAPSHPLDEQEEGGAGAGVVGNFGGGECACVAADQAGAAVGPNGR